MLLVALLLVGLGGGGTVWWLIQDARVKVPPVVGKTEQVARTELTKLGLKMHMSGTIDDSMVPKGDIASQIPLAGTPVDRGTIIQVMVSGVPTEKPAPPRTQPAATNSSATADPPSQPTRPVSSRLPQPDAAVTVDSTPVSTSMVVVPKLRGHSLSHAKRQLQTAGLQPGTVRYQTDEDRMPGIILKQQPKEGTRVASGSKVDLTVNSTE